MLLSEHQKRIDTLIVAEKLLQRREQQVSIREDVLREALRAGPSGATAEGAQGNWEREIDRLVIAAASRLAPPVAVGAFVRSLEDRAVELEVLHSVLERRGAALEEERRALAHRQAQMAHKEVYLAKWMAAMEASLQGMCAQEDALASQARQRQEGEAELRLWTHQLREKEDTLENRERVIAAKLEEVAARAQRVHHRGEGATMRPILLARAPHLDNVPHCVEGPTQFGLEDVDLSRGPMDTADSGAGDGEAFERELTPLEAALRMRDEVAGESGGWRAGPTSFYTGPQWRGDQLTGVDRPFLFQKRTSPELGEGEAAWSHHPDEGAVEGYGVFGTQIRGNT